MLTDIMKPFDAEKKEQQLRKEANEWDTSQAVEASEGDIPVLDLTEYFTTGSDESLQKAADMLRVACEEVGFFSIPCPER